MPKSTRALILRRACPVAFQAFDDDVSQFFLVFTDIVESIQGNVQCIESDGKTGSGFFIAVVYPDLDGFGNGPVAPEETAVGDIAGIAASHFDNAFAVFGLVDELGDIVTEGFDVVHGIAFSGSTGKEGIGEVNETEVELHGEGICADIQFGRVGCLDIADFVPFALATVARSLFQTRSC